MKTKSAAALVLSNEYPVSEYVLISAFTKGKTLGENMMRHESLARTLGDLNMMHQAVIGCYKGDTERSILVIVSNEGELNTLVKLARSFDQESILHKNAQGIDLLFITPEGYTWEPIGRNFSQGSGSEDAWTKTPCGRYYVVSQ